MASPYVTTLFGQSVKRVLDGWTALQLAVRQGFGGVDSQEKAEWMVYAIETWFKENANIESYELEDFLSDVMNSEFDMVLEDASLPQIAVSICNFYRLCSEGHEDEVRQSLGTLPQASLQGCVQDNVQTEEVEAEDDGDMADASCGGGNQETGQTNQPAPDKSSQSENQQNSSDSMDMEVEDGWEVVKRGRKK